MIQDIKTRGNRRSGQWDNRSLTWKIVGASCLVAIATIGMATNPNQEDYETFATQQATRILLQDLCARQPQLPLSIQQWLKQECSALSQGSTEQVQRLISSNTQRHNFFLLSLFTTDLPGYRLHTLGIGRHFFVFEPW